MQVRAGRAVRGVEVDDEHRARHGTFAAVTRMAPDRRILFFGDSFVAGVGDPAGLGWVGRVAAAAHAAGQPLTAYNLGVRRDTSADVMRRLRAEAQARTGAADASYGVVVGLGTNDTTEEHGRVRVEPGVAVDNLGRVIEAARELGVDVFVVGPPPAGEPAHDERVCALSRRFARLAADPASRSSRPRRRCEQTAPGRTRPPPATERTPAPAATRRSPSSSWEVASSPGPTGSAEKRTASAAKTNKGDQVCVFFLVMNKTLLILAVLALAVGLVACGGTDEGGSGSSTKLNLVAYSTPKEAYEEIVPAFAKTPDGTEVTFSQSYGNSGDQARAVVAGLPTDIAALSLEPDITKLVDAQLVAADWSSTPTKGIVTHSVVALAVRPGNPKNIRGWADLVKPGVEVLTPNPFTSGGARWNIIAAYGAQLEQGRTEAEAVAYLERLFKNVVVQDKSARESLQSFTGGKGDVLISYENEAITAQQKGEKLDYIVPDETILIENPIAATIDAPDTAQAFIRFATSAPAQRIFATKGYRSVIDGLVDAKRYPTPPKQFDITKFGGWAAVMKTFFDPKDSVMQRIEKSLGVGTS